MADGRPIASCSGEDGTRRSTGLSHIHVNFVPRLVLALAAGEAEMVAQNQRRSPPRNNCAPAYADGLSDLADIGRLAIGQHEYGLTEAQSRRLRGETADAVRADARQMRRELRLPDLDERDRDEHGRFRTKGVDVNAAIRQAAGR
jgi:hypothetical protein